MGVVFIVIVKVVLEVGVILVINVEVSIFFNVWKFVYFDFCFVLRMFRWCFYFVK